MPGRSSPAESNAVSAGGLQQAPLPRERHSPQPGSCVVFGAVEGWSAGMEWICRQGRCALLCVAVGVLQGSACSMSCAELGLLALGGALCAYFCA